MKYELRLNDKAIDFVEAETPEMALQTLIKEYSLQNRKFCPVKDGYTTQPVEFTIVPVRQVMKGKS